MTTKNSQRICQAIKDMLKVNPNAEISHDVEDFVVENFHDRPKVLNYDGSWNESAMEFFQIQKLPPRLIPSYLKGFIKGIEEVNRP